MPTYDPQLINSFLDEEKKRRVEQIKRDLKEDRERIDAESAEKSYLEIVDAQDKHKAFYEAASKAADLSLQGYEGYLALIMGVIGLFQKGMEKSAASSALAPIVAFFRPYGREMVDAVRNKFNLDEKKAVKTPMILPSLQVGVRFKDDNTLDEDSINEYFKREDGIELTDEQKKTIRQGVYVWLLELGYEANPVPKHRGQFIAVDTRQVLTKAEFIEKRDDPTRGFLSFCTGNFQLKCMRAEIDDDVPSKGPHP